MRLSIRAVIRLSVFVTLPWLVSTAWAAPTVFVDNVGTCSGNTPCFNTIQEAVNNAGPAPATVRIYAGTYNEGVNLSLMGSAIAGSLGTITIESVSGGVTVDGSADPAFYLTSILTGNLTFTGLSVTSPSAQRSGIEITATDGVPGPLGGGVIGNVTVTNVTANNSGNNGIVVEIPAGASGNVTITNVTATGNGTAGNGDGVDINYLAGASGIIIVDNLIADSNEDDGFDVDAESANASVTVRNSTANNSVDGDGFDPDTLGDVVIENSTANSNDNNGIEVDEVVGNVRLSDTTTNNNGNEGIRIDGEPSPAITSSVTVLRVTSNSNGDDGLDVEANVGTLTVQDSTFDGNDEGIELFDDVPVPSAAVNISCNSMSGNSSAGLSLAESLIITATNNWWGASSGPQHPTNPSGTGNAVEDSANGEEGTVNFIPFLDAPPGPSCGSTGPLRPIPTLSQWALILLALLMVGLGLTQVRRFR